MDGPDDMSSANFSSHFLTIAEVAAAMRVSKMTVYRLVKSHAIAAVRVGRSFRVPEEAVNDYIRRVTEPATLDQEDKKDDKTDDTKDDTKTD
jgi:excisionase family DNA binding protein